MTIKMEYEPNARNISVIEDASGSSGKAKRVVFPRNSADLQRFVKLSDKITIRGGGSGLAGGAIPQNAVVIDMSKMNKIIEIDRLRKIAVVEAGVLLGELNEELEKHGLEFPVNHSAPYVATIGGMIATNATGSRSCKYGRAGEWAEEVEVVDGSGKTQRIQRLDISNFVGMEGITGAIFKAKLRLIEKPIRSLTIYRAKELVKIIELVKKLKTISKTSMIQLVGREIAKELGMEEAYYLFVEVEGEEGRFKGAQYFEKLSTLSKIYPTMAKLGYIRIEDPKVFLDKLENMVAYFELNKIPYFGEMGRGVVCAFFKKTEEEKARSVLQYIKKNRGQVAGSYGFGILKKEFLEQTDKNLITRVKNRYDPLFKLNPGVVIDKFDKKEENNSEEQQKRDTEDFNKAVAEAVNEPVIEEKENETFNEEPVNEESKQHNQLVVDEDWINKDTEEKPEVEEIEEIQTMEDVERILEEEMKAKIEGKGEKEKQEVKQEESTEENKNEK